MKGTTMKVALAAVSGFALGFYICRQMMEQTYIDAANEEVAKMEEALKVKENLDEAVDVLSKINDEREEDGIPPLGESEISKKHADVPVLVHKTTEETGITPEVAERQMTAYGAMFQKDETTRDFVERMMPPMAKSKPVVPPQSRMVSETAFFAEPLGTSLQLTYYAGVNMLLDTQTKEIVKQDTILRLLGDYYLDASNYTGEDRILYLRADAVDTDIEVKLDLGTPED